MYTQDWIYLGKLQKHHIRIHHDVQEGTASVFLNGSELSKAEGIDHKGYTFQFFIDDELCLLKIRYSAGRYNYSFKSSRRSTSTSSRRRQKDRSFHTRRAGFYLVGFVAIIICLPIVIHLLNKSNDARELREHGVETLGVLVPPDGSTIMDNCYYKYAVDGVTFKGSTELFVTDRGTMLTTNGMPAVYGDEFTIIYSAKNHDLSKIDFSKPSDLQIQRYMERAIQTVIASMNPERSAESRNGYANCICTYIYVKEGIPGLADIVFKDERFYVNKKHNSQTFQDLMNKPEYRVLMDSCRNQWLEF